MEVCLRENAIIFFTSVFHPKFHIEFHPRVQGALPGGAQFCFPAALGLRLGSPGRSQAFLGAPGLSWAPLGSTRRSQGLGSPGFPSFSWVLLGIPGSSWVLLGFPAWALLGAPGLSWALLGFPGLSPGLSPGLLSAALFFAQFFTDSSGEDAVQKGAWRRQRVSILIARFFQILRVRLFQQRSRFITPSSRF